jgi:hypothetical protein
LAVKLGLPNWKSLLALGQRYWIDEGTGSDLSLLLVAGFLPLLLLFQMNLSPNIYWGDGSIARHIFPRFALDQGFLTNGHAVPWWNPFFANGIPWAAGAASTRYPVYLWLLQELSATSAITGFVLFHRVLASVGMAFLARRLGNRRASALTVAVIYSVGGPTMAYLYRGEWDSLAALAYLPMVFGLWLQALRCAGLAWTVLAGVALGALVSCGCLPVSVATIALLVLCGLARLFDRGIQDIRLSRRSVWTGPLQTPQSLRASALALSLKVAVVLGIAALGNLADVWAQISSLGDPSSPVQFFRAVPTCGPMALLTMVVGNLFDGSTIDQTWVPWAAGESRLAITATGFYLVLLCLNNRPVRRWWVAGCGVLITAIVGFEPGLLGPLPGAVQPGCRTLFFSFFFLCWIIAEGSDFLLETGFSPSARRIGMWLIGILSLACLALNYAQATTGWWKTLLGWLLELKGHNQVLSPKELEVLLVGTYCRVSWVLILTAGMYATCLSSCRTTRALGILFIVMLESFTLVFPDMTFADRGHFVLPERLNIYLLRANPLFRVAMSEPWSGGAMPLDRPELAGAFLPSPAYAQAYGLAHYILGNTEAFVTPADPRPALKAMAVRYFIRHSSIFNPQAQGLVETRISAKDEIYGYETVDPQARAGFVRDIVYSDQGLRVTARMARGQEGGLAMVLPARLKNLKLTGDVTATFSGLALETDRVSLRSHCSEPTLFVLRDAWARDWRATLDGSQALEIYPVDSGLFRGVICPVGEHKIEMVYRPCPIWSEWIERGARALLLPPLLLSILAMWLNRVRGAWRRPGRR